MCKRSFATTITHYLFNNIFHDTLLQTQLSRSWWICGEMRAHFFAEIYISLIAHFSSFLLLPSSLTLPLFLVPLKHVVIPSKTFPSTRENAYDSEGFWTWFLKVFLCCWKRKFNFFPLCMLQKAWKNMNKIKKIAKSLPDKEKQQEIFLDFLFSVFFGFLNVKWRWDVCLLFVKRWAKRKICVALK